MNKLCKLIDEMNRISNILASDCTTTYNSYSKFIDYKDGTIYFLYDILIDRFMIIMSNKYIENMDRAGVVLYGLTSQNFLYGKDKYIPLSEIKDLRKMDDIQLILSYGRDINIDDELLSIMENYNE